MQTLHVLAFFATALLSACAGSSPSVNTAGVLEVTPSGGFMISGLEGGPFAPASLDYTLTNSSTQPISWDAQSSVAWCTISPSSGQLAPGVQETVTVAIEPSAADALPAGSHSGALSFRNVTTESLAHLRTAQITVDTLPGGPSMQDSLTQFGVTWTFDHEYEVGQFANGDWWVVGQTTVIGISPPSSDVAGRTMNGSMVNPSPSLDLAQGYDSTMYGIYMLPQYYDSNLNVALDLSPTSPLTLAPHSSLVSTISEPAAGVRPQLLSAAILTVLPAPPTAGSFRPAYCGTNKSILHSINDLDYSLLANLPPVASTPDFSTVERYFERPWIDHVPGWLGRFIHPSQNMPDYGREISDEAGIGALMLHLDYTESQKERLLIRYVQLGIDFYGVVADSGSDNWAPNGGHASGRKWPILFAGLVLADPLMSGIGQDVGVQFGEDGQTFYVEESSPGVYNGGFGGYNATHLGMPEWGIQHTLYPNHDSVDWYSNYRECCTANCWYGGLLAARIMDVRSLWNNDALFDYQDRYLATVRSLNSADWIISWSTFPLEMWDAYRASY